MLHRAQEHLTPSMPQNEAGYVPENDAWSVRPLSRGKEGARASLPLLSVGGTLRPDTDCNNRALRGRCKRCACLLLRSTRVRSLLHKLNRSCTYVWGPICINKSRFELDRDEERFHTSPFSAGRSLCVRSAAPAVVKNGVTPPRM